MIDGAIAKHLKVLRFMPGGHSRVRLVQGIRDAHAFDRFLRNAVDHHRRRDSSGFEDRWHDVNHVVELVANATFVRDAVGPGQAHALLGSPEVGGHLLGPLERRIKRPRPATDMCGKVLSDPQAS